MLPPSWIGDLQYRVVNRIGRHRTHTAGMHEGSAYVHVLSLVILPPQFQWVSLSWREYQSRSYLTKEFVVIVLNLGAVCLQLSDLCDDTQYHDF